MVYLTAVSAIPDSLQDAYRHCARITYGHYENFPVASWLIPRQVRPHVCSIYAFARTADDFADEPGMDPEERLEKLADWRDRLLTCAASPRGPIFEALAETIRRHDIPMTLLTDLLDAFTQDVLQPRHETFDDLIDYSRRSANPVGRLVLTLFGYADAERFDLSDRICTGLQLANFWQDVSVDAARGRFYVPQACLRDHGITEADLVAGRLSDGFRTMMAGLTTRTRALFHAGSGLPELVGGRLRFELRLTILGGVRILDRIDQVRFDVFHHRPTIGRLAGLGLLFRSLRPVRTSS